MAHLVRKFGLKLDYARASLACYVTRTPLASRAFANLAKLATNNILLARSYGPMLGRVSISLSTFIVIVVVGLACHCFEVGTIFAHFQLCQ